MAAEVAPITVSVPSDVAPLREAVVGVVKPFTWESLAAESEPGDDREATRALVRHNRVEIPDAGRSGAEHAVFLEVLREHGVTVHLVEEIEGVSVQLYPRDLAFAVDHLLVLARSRVGARRRERHGIDHVLRAVDAAVELDEGRIEGGDVIVTTDDVLVGLGEETDPAGVEALRRALAAHGVDRRVVPIELAQRGVVHLDTKFTMVGEEVGLVHREAFTPASLALLAARFDLVDVTAEEARDLQVNTLALDPTTVVVRETGTRVMVELEARGITPVPVPFAEISRFPGAYRCATLPLRRG